MDVIVYVPLTKRPLWPHSLDNTNGDNCDQGVVDGCARIAAGGDALVTDVHTSLIERLSYTS